LPYADGMAITALRPSPHVRASFSDDGLVLLDIDRGVVLSANAVGARIWELIELRYTFGDIADRVAADYSMPADRVRADLTAFVDALRARNLVIEESCSRG